VEGLAQVMARAWRAAKQTLLDSTTAVPLLSSKPLPLPLHHTAEVRAVCEPVLWNTEETLNTRIYDTIHENIQEHLTMYAREYRVWNEEERMYTRMYKST